jgi:DNA replication and repair protein RecF
MQVEKISLKNFRNWEERSFDLSQKVLIYGPNARGKTNILEAVYLAATSRSFRGKDLEMIKNGEDFSKVEAIIKKDGPVDVEIIIKNEENFTKEFKIQGRKRPAIDFVGEFSAIVFSPDDINLISAPPEQKRRYLSYTIGQKDKQYLYDLLNYKKILRQRNELLKRCDLGTIREEIDVWDTSLAQYGENIIKKRKELAEFINQRVREYYKQLSGEDRVIEFRYLPSAKPGELKEKLSFNRERDQKERNTTVGPHRDDWEILIDYLGAEGYASRGEERTLILALKLCERDYFASRDGILPLILLDDVFSELDITRRRFLIESFKDSQIILTTTDLDHLDDSLRAGFQLINIDSLQPTLSLELE